jgi:NAD(P)-dependent dehydrogenase (short-subunit alcohol dehydrogenase family)
MIETGLKDKTVIVTGANHDIESAAVLAFVREGAKIFIH